MLYTDDHNGTADIYGQRYLPPLARFSAAPLSGSAPLTVTFTERSTFPTTDSRQWDFGDGVTSTLASPEHTYIERGAYAVTLTASAGLYTHTLRKTNYVFVGLPHPTLINYTYDGLYRLTKADTTGESPTTFQYAYDAVGNRTTQTRTLGSTEVITYAYDEANRLIDVGGVTYTWDDNGNLLNDGETTYTYNQANRLTAIEDGLSTITYAYNGDGVRLQQVNSGASITYTQDLAAPLPVVLQSQIGESATQYLYALGTRPLAQYGTAWEYLRADALGSVRQIVDADGNVTLAESYEPYGSVLSSTGTASSIFGYSGEETDTSGLVFLRARYMNPTLGLFLARDPWSGDQLRPGSMNGWNYAGNNPIPYTDPSGRERISDPQAAGKRCDELGFRANDIFRHACMSYLQEEDHDWLRRFMDVGSIGQGIFWGTPDAEDNMRHYLWGDGSPKQFSSKWYLYKSGGVRLWTTKDHDQIGTITALEAEGLGNKLRRQRLEYSPQTCGLPFRVGSVEINNKPNRTLDKNFFYAIGRHMLNALYIDDPLRIGQCSCAKKYYIKFWVDDPYDFIDPDQKQRFKLPVGGGNIPFRWLDELSTAKPPRATIFHSKVNWTEEIDVSTGHKIYHHDVGARTPPMPYD